VNKRLGVKLLNLKALAKKLFFSRAITKAFVKAIYTAASIKYFLLTSVKRVTL